LRVGVIGTGSSAIQSIPIIAQQASHLTVFQRTATWSVPAWNEKLTPEYLKDGQGRLSGVTCQSRARPTGFYFPFNTMPALEARAEDRDGSTRKPGGGVACPSLALTAICCSRKPPMTPIADFARKKIRSIVKDPATAALLCPDNVLGCKRLCVDTGYFENVQPAACKTGRRLQDADRALHRRWNRDERRRVFRWMRSSAPPALPP